MEVMRRINWNPKNQIVEESKPTPPSVPRQEPKPVQTSVIVQPKLVARVNPKVTRNRTGNGHKSEMVRKLNDQERDYIRGAFLNKNGQLEEDDCVRIKPALGNEVAIFQVTGFVSYLHRDVAIGKTQVRDLPAYKQWMQDKYSGLWVQFNSQRVTELRHRNAAHRALNERMEGASIQDLPITPQFSTTPQFKALPRRFSYARTGT